jgi:hypothetical protein
LEICSYGYGGASLTALVTPLDGTRAQGGWKYVTHQGAWKFKWPKEELYDLAVDPKENNNLADVQVEKVRLFRSRSKEMMKEMGYALDRP